jgi:hypothetical protein
MNARHSRVLHVQNGKGSTELSELYSVSPHEICGNECLLASDTVEL